MTESEVETERVTVQTYVPQYQREEWDAHAEELDMSRSEFVKTMVQAGRRGFLDERQAPEEVESDEDSDASGGVATDLETQVIDALSREAHLSWDELLAAVTDGIEDQLEDTLQDLQAADRVRYSGRNGGYTIDE